MDRPKIVDVLGEDLELYDCVAYTRSNGQIAIGTIEGFECENECGLVYHYILLSGSDGTRKMSYLGHRSLLLLPEVYKGYLDD